MTQLPGARADPPDVPISGSRRLPGWRAYLLGGAAATVVYLLLPPGVWAHAIGYAAVAGSGIAAVLLSVRRYRPQQPSTWYTFAVGLAFWLGNSALDRVAAGQAWTTVSEVLGVAGYPFVGWAIVGLIRGRARADDRTGLIDAGIVATSLALPYWIFVVGPAVGDAAVSPAERAGTLLYAIGDIILFALCSLLVTTPGARTASYRMLIGALVMSIAGDVLVVLAPTASDRAAPADVALLLSNTLVAAAATHPSMRRLTVPLARPPAFVRPRLTLLVAAILLAPVVSLYLGATGHIGDNWLAAGVIGIVLFLLVTLRMAGLVRRVESQARRLAQLAHEDALTGLPNRRQWDDRLPAALAESRATGEALTLCMIDLDHFKRYNDTYGHQAGDELLAGAAAAWGAVLRGEDLLARYGGEEFALLLMGRTAEEATQIAERMLAATPSRQTFSAGLACWDGRESPDDLLRRADELLYASKHAGRARISAALIPISGALPR